MAALARILVTVVLLAYMFAGSTVAAYVIHALVLGFDATAILDTSQILDLR